MLNLFKAISITDDTARIGNNCVPWSLYEQLKTADISYDPRMNPILLIPNKPTEFQDKLEHHCMYELFLFGKSTQQLSGQAFMAKADYYAQTITNTANQLRSSSFLISEGMGKGFGNLDYISQIANWSFFDAQTTKIVLIINAKSEHLADNLAEALLLVAEKGLDIAGCIFTKVTGASAGLDAAENSIRAQGISAIGKIPYNKDYIGELSDYLAWSNYVSTCLGEPFFDEFLNAMERPPAPFIT